MSNERQYALRFSTQTYADSVSDAVSVAQAQFESGDHYVEIDLVPENGQTGMSWEFDTITEALAHTGDQMQQFFDKSPTPKTDYVREYVEAIDAEHEACRLVRELRLDDTVQEVQDKMRAAFIERHEMLHRIFADNRPEDTSGVDKAFDFLLNRFPRTMDIHPAGPWKTPKGMLVVEEWGQADKKTKKALAKLVKKHKRIIKKGKK